MGRGPSTTTKNKGGRRPAFLFCPLADVPLTCGHRHRSRVGRRRGKAPPATDRLAGRYAATEGGATDQARRKLIWSDRERLARAATDRRALGRRLEAVAPSGEAAATIGAWIG